MERRIVFDFSLKSVFKIVFGLILLWLMFYLREVIVLFLLSFIFATALEPIVNALNKKGIPRWSIIIGIISVIIFGLYGLFRLIIPPITVQLNHLIDNRYIITERAVNYLDNTPDVIKNAVYDFSNNFPEKIAKYSSSINVVDDALGIFSGFLGFVTVLVIAFYLLIENNSMENFIKDYWPTNSKEKAVKIFNQIVEKISLWARGQLILSGSIGLLTFIGLSILKVDYALTLALFAAITALLPVIGPFIAAAPAIFIAFTVNPVLALWVALLYIGIQQFENHVLVPQVMKRAVGLSPTIIIFSILVGAKLLGIIGIIIAVPVASAVGVLVKSTKKKED